MSSKIYISSAFAAIGGFLFGYHTGVISGVITMPSFASDITNSNRTELHKSENIGIVGTLLFGCFIGSIISGQTSDRFSRKYSILASSIIFIISAFLQIIYANLSLLIIARFIAGLSIGALSMVIPVYQSEISTKELRGRIVSFQQLAITFGIAVSYWINYGTIIHYKNSSTSWRLPLGFQIIPGFILSIGILLFPHSPRWLITQDRENEALNVLRKIRNINEIENEFNEIKNEVAKQRENEIEKYSQLFHYPFLRRILLAIFIQIFDQLTGINSIIYYSPFIFQQANIMNYTDPIPQALLATGLVGCVNFLATIPAVFLLDKLGRRFVLIFGSIIMTISMFILAILMITCDSNGNTIKCNSNTSIGIIIFIFIFIIGFACSWGPTAWIYCAEIFPISMRAKATSITTATHWIVNCTITILVPLVIQKHPYIAFFIFGCFCFLMGIIVYLFYPETKGRSLEEMDPIFSGSIVYRSANIFVF